MAIRKDGIDTHEKLLKAASEVFAKKGFYNAKVSEIAREASVADGTIYLYFKNKDDILISLFEEKMHLWIQQVDEVVSKVDDPLDKIRAFVDDTIRVFLQAEPNPGHLALGTLEHIGILKSVITQNVDNLHQEAGNKNVIEMHGNLFRQRCLACGAKKPFGREEYLGSVKKALDEMTTFDLPSILAVLPKCDCGSPMRPDVVMFGEAVQGLYESFQEADNCEAMLVLGTPQKDTGFFDQSKIAGLAREIEEQTGVPVKLV